MKSGHLLKNYSINTATTNIATTYTQIDAVGLGQECSLVYAYNGGSQPLILAAGVTGHQTQICSIMPGIGQTLDVLIPRGALWLQANAGTAQSTGQVVLDFYT